VNKTEIGHYIASGRLEKRFVDMMKARSLIEAAIESGKIYEKLKLEKSTATIIFKSIYDGFHQLGEARWSMLGYKPKDHQATLAILLDANIAQGHKLYQLDRFRRLRNDTSYEGYRISVGEAIEIAKLWKEVSLDIINWIRG